MLIAFAGDECACIQHRTHCKMVVINVQIRICNVVSIILSLISGRISSSDDAVLLRIRWQHSAIQKANDLE